MMGWITAITIPTPTGIIAARQYDVPPPLGCHRRFSRACPAFREPGTQKDGSEGAIPEQGKGRNTPGLTLL